MERSRLIEWVIVGLYLFIAVIVFINHSKDNQKIIPIPKQLILSIVPESKKDHKYNVRKIIVLRGDNFDLTMKDENNTRILGKLSVMATDNAKEKVLDLLNHSINPRVILREKQPDGRWIIDFSFTNNDKELDLVQWLISNNLVYK